MYCFKIYEISWILAAPLGFADSLYEWRDLVAGHPARTRRERLRCTPRLSESDPPASPEGEADGGQARP